MLIVDTSVWIDFFHNRDTVQTQRLADTLVRGRIGMLDIILLEILRGFRRDDEYQRVKERLSVLPFFQTLDKQSVVEYADFYRSLRKRGITVRKQNDVIIAGFCIRSGLPLLFADKDFHPFVAHLGLIDAQTDSPPFLS